MKHELGWFFPDGERHLPQWLKAANEKRDGLLQYQYFKYIAAMKYVRSFKVAVDVGAHIGQWSRNMAVDFQNVDAFEPVPMFGNCWRKNLLGFENVQLHPVALGKEPGIVNLACTTPGSYGDTYVSEKKNKLMAHGVEMRALDSYGFQTIDFIKIDCEGYEFFLLQGAEQTIRRTRPCVIVEQKPGKANLYGLGEIDAVLLLESWGAIRRETISGDYILSWDSDDRPS